MLFSDLHLGRIAITIQDCNQEDERASRIITSINAFCTLNKIQVQQVRAIIFSQTKDITTSNPAQLLRYDDAFNRTALFCTSEPEYSSSITLAIRMLVMFNKFTWRRYYPKAVYMYGAEVLRPDLVRDTIVE